MNKKITAKLTLFDIYGEGLSFNARCSYTLYGWLSQDQDILNSLTGKNLVIAGAMPIICSHSVTDLRVFRLLQAAGLPLPSYFSTYTDKKSYLAELSRSSTPIVFQHVHPADEISDELYWISPQLLSYLNNKANLTELAPVGTTPRRKLIPLANLIEETQLPVVVKVASAKSSGGGCGVRICRCAEDINQAAADFIDCAEIIVEEYLEFPCSLCVQFAAMPDGEIRYLGTAEQVVNEDGQYLGNWLDDDAQPDYLYLKIGRQVMEKAISLGYRGVAGFDMTKLADGRVIIFDLNFRLNGSTVPLLLYESIRELKGSPVMQFRSWSSGLSLTDLLTVAERWIKENHFIPFSVAQYQASPRVGISGLIIGSTRAEVSELEAHFRSEISHFTQ